LGIVLRNEKVYRDKDEEATARIKTVITTGLHDAASTKTFGTIPEKNGLDLRPSNNIKGGAQFTYSFWINIGSGISNEVADKIIFMKGTDKRYNFDVTDISTGTLLKYRNEMLVYSPMVKFGKNAQTLEVCFNTMAHHNEKLVISKMETDDNTTRNNVLSMVQGSWALITITFEDNIPINEFENGIVVKIYVQDQLYRVGRYQTALKQNYGDFILFPNKEAISDVKISDLSYFNYALSPRDIEDIVQKGPNLSISKTYMPSSQPPTLSDYNKLDIYN
jgi:hypothetical protein